MATIDGNEAAAYIAHKTNEVIAIYPITPASPMGELCDQWSAVGAPNLWGSVPQVIEMQSEAGAAGAVHGALQAGALTTTFTASQGLLLMIPEMFKIAGELTPTVFHIAARTVATHALSIFGDHSDVMATRTTGWAMIFSNSVQEAMDFALIAQAATLESRIPFLHTFDGFRTSHEVQKVDLISDDSIRSMLNEELIRDHRTRSLSPEKPKIRGTAQNPDVFFQSREAINPYYLAAAEIVERSMERFANLTGRRYRLFDYAGADDAERVVVLMGSGCETAEETVRFLAERGEKVGLVKVRLFRPFSVEHFLASLPASVKTIVALDRTKEPGSIGEPLYQDIVAAVSEGMANGASPFASAPRVLGGRYGLSSKEFTPAMVKAVLDEAGKESPKNHFTVGIVDDVTHLSLEYDPSFSTEPEEVKRALFWGLGSDGTVGANKNSTKIIGEATANHVQAYFVYDSKKAGARTISHLRFGPNPIQSTYLIQKADFVAVHQFGFLDRFEMLREAEHGATLLVNSPYGPDEVWAELPRPVQEQILEKGLKFFVIDAYTVAKEKGLGIRINTIMQVCFFALSEILPVEEAIDRIKESIRKTYGSRGEVVVKMNIEAVDAALERLHRVEVPKSVAGDRDLLPVVPVDAPDFIRKVTGEILAGEGDSLPVSAFPADGTFPSGTTRWEKRNICLEVPVWEPDICIQCGKCVIACPHSVIRAKVFEEDRLGGAPTTFKSARARWKELPDRKYSLQVAVEDCTGCAVCVEVCPAKDKAKAGRRAINMAEQKPLRDWERANWEFFLGLPEAGRATPAAGNGLKFTKVKDVQLLDPLFEFSSACAGCGETPYLRLMSQLFGDRAYVSNATGCSSIYGGNLPTTPWSANKDGRGPAWTNSLFEDNAEFGLGMRLAIDKQREYARELLKEWREELEPNLVDSILDAETTAEAGVEGQRKRVSELKRLLEGMETAWARDLQAVADSLVPKSVWIVGGDGWAYDIGYGGLDHVLSTGKNVNLLVLDTEVYSNTGGQASKATPLGAIAKFAAGGKRTARKDLGMLAMSHGHVYVAEVALGANDNQCIRAFREAESYDGPSLIIAYSQCIAHGIDMRRGMQQQELATASGYWPLYRYDPRRKEEGKNPFQLDSKPPRVPLEEYVYKENRYSALVRSNPDVARELLGLAEESVRDRWRMYDQMARVEVAEESKS